MLLYRLSNVLSECFVILIKLLLLFFSQQLFRCCHNIFHAQVGYLTDAVAFKCLISRLNSLHQILLPALNLYVLLPNELKEFSHL